jgi:hypothetical protein
MIASKSYQHVALVSITGKLQVEINETVVSIEPGEHTNAVMEGVRWSIRRVSSSSGDQ